MATLLKVSAAIEKLAPIALVESWDNTGWQVFLGDAAVTRVVVCLTVTEDVVLQAKELECNLIVAHHPLIFGGLKSLNVSRVPDASVVMAVQNGISVYSAHTNLDSADEGTAATLAGLLELQDVCIPAVNDKAVNFIRTGVLKEEYALDDFINRLKSVLKTDSLRVVGYNPHITVSKVGLCPGGGAEFIPQMTDVDVYVTSDIKYHNAADTREVCVIDAGHYETERPVLEILRRTVAALGVEAFVAQENPVWKVV